MLADHFAKPLQGEILRKFRAEIQGTPTSMYDGDIEWDELGPFNVPLKEDDTATVKPILQECVRKDQNNDILIAPSTNVGDGERRGFESCLVVIRNDDNKIRHCPRISYCEAANQVLTQADIKQKSVIIL